MPSIAALDPVDGRVGRIVAIDSGLTVTKAVVFDLAGRQLGVARRSVEQRIPAPRRVERDMVELWRHTAMAIRDALAASGTAPGDVVAVAATAHGDGVYLLDHAGAPLGHGILSLDSRAGAQVARWQADGTAARSLMLTGQEPHVSAPSALLAWVQENEPERFAAIGHVFACKDWLRYCLTGTIGTDRTEASTSFTDVATQVYAPDALDLFGLDALAHALPPIAGSAEIVGHVTDAAGRATGLTPGTPVAAGLHDVTASALGIGAHVPGVVGVVAGTYSINECVTDTPRTGAGWFCRNAVAPGRWNAMAISPASTTNYDWFLDTLCAADAESAALQGRSIHAKLADEIAAGLARAAPVVWHPYLFGSPQGPGPSAGFLGLRGWHDRGDMLAALLEGVAFNHRHHVDTLRAAFPADTARLTGGVSRNPVVAQLFADVLGMEVAVTDTDESAAWGAALCAGAAVGAFVGPETDPRDMDAIATVYRPDTARAARYADRYATWRAIADDLAPVWDRLNAMPQGSTHDG
jgi:L-xylulokinase